MHTTRKLIAATAIAAVLAGGGTAAAVTLTGGHSDRNAAVICAEWTRVKADLANFNAAADPADNTLTPDSNQLEASAKQAGGQWEAVVNGKMTGTARRDRLNSLCHL